MKFQPYSAHSVPRSFARSAPRSVPEVAVVGGGISGLVAARALHPHVSVRVFEAAPELGGHTYTVSVDDPAGPQRIDMGFIVHNDRTYPNFCRLLDELGVATESSDMSFSVRSERTGFEWNGTDLGGIFAQRRSLLRPSVYRMLLGILRFHRHADEFLFLDPDVTLGEVLERKGWGGPFVDLYLVPMVSAIWSTDPSRVLEMPARTLVAFLHNHGMLKVNDRPTWRVVSGGSQHYVSALAEPFRHRIDVATPVLSLRRRADGVDLVLGGRRRGEIYRTDAVVLACHSDQALAMLSDPTEAEEEVLRALPYSRNDVVLHTDTRLMPRGRRAWAAWNYHHDLPAGELETTPDAWPDSPSGGREGSVDGTSRVTYWMNRLQNLRAERQYFVSLNRTAAIDPETIVHRVTFGHPLFTAEGVRAQGRWSEVSNGRTFYSGAYWGWGFHEDGVKSGLRAAHALASRLGLDLADGGERWVEGVGLDEFGRDGFGGGPPSRLDVPLSDPASKQPPSQPASAAPGDDETPDPGAEKNPRETTPGERKAA